jgi:hypothetical protein
VHFHLDHPGFVTLVVENERGTRARNLVSETYFSSGDQVAWWMDWMKAATLWAI